MDITAVAGGQSSRATGPAKRTGTMSRTPSCRVCGISSSCMVEINRKGRPVR
ncbi:MAG: hypothetical protein KBA08_05315 [Firmicutes bacterium]|nr:hypothetical protein [Bacillota bacterium]